MESEATLNAGDVCLDCQQKGLAKYLRHFKVNLHGDTILKCESNQCMYPYDDELCSSDDEDFNSLDNSAQTNSLKLINDLIRQFDYDEKVHQTVIENVSEQVTQFDITFLNDFDTANNENLCKTELSDEKSDYSPLLQTETKKCDMSSKISDDNKKSQNVQMSANLFDENVTHSCDVTANEMPSDDNIIVDTKENITIQSIETLKYKKCALNQELPTTSKTLSLTAENSSKLAAEDSQENICTGIKFDVKKKIKKDKLKLDAISKPSTTSPLLNATKSSPKKAPQTLDIPKADILKANAVLKRFATIEDNDESPKYNRKYRKERRKDSQKRKTDTEPKPPLPSPLNTDANYSFDKITQMLLAKK